MPYTTPRTWVTGELVTAALLNTQLRDNLNAAFPLAAPDVAWTTFVPTLTQSVTVTKTVTYASYFKLGRVVFAVISLAITGAGTTSNAILVGLPVVAASTSGIVGTFRYFRSGVTIYAGTAYGASTQTVELDTSGNGTPLGITPLFPTANGDNVQVSVTYESAT